MNATAIEFRGSSRTVADVLAETRSLVEPAYRSSVSRLAPPMSRIAGYHAGWWDEKGRPSSNAGKAIRPALVFAAAKAMGAVDLQQCVAEAVAVEIIHDFTLLHDDLMDGDLRRRHRPTAWSVFGKSEALLAGDTLLALAVNELASRPSMPVLASALASLCLGQSADLEFESRSTVGIDECVRMIEGKTASLLSCACEMGGIAGGADLDKRRLLAEFGHHLGMAFQLIDDVLGIWGEPEKSGKPIYSDLANRKKSPPVVAALASRTPAAAELRELYMSARNDPETIRRMASLIESSGARHWAEQEAEKQLTNALDRLYEISMGDDVLDLRLLANLVTNRSA